VDVEVSAPVILLLLVVLLRLVVVIMHNVILALVVPSKVVDEVRPFLLQIN
jgi:hypothetical protein